MYQKVEIALRPSKLFGTIKLDKKVTLKIVRKVRVGRSLPPLYLLSVGGLIKVLLSPKIPQREHKFSKKLKYSIKNIPEIFLQN